MNTEVSGRLFYGFVQPPTLNTWDETWDDAADRINDESSQEAKEIMAFLRERGVEWRTFGQKEHSLWYALSVQASELDFGVECPQIVKPERFAGIPESEWKVKLITCANKLKLNRHNLLANWYIGSSYL